MNQHLRMSCENKGLSVRGMKESLQRSIFGKVKTHSGRKISNSWDDNVARGHFQPIQGNLADVSVARKADKM